MAGRPDHGRDEQGGVRRLLISASTVPRWAGDTLPAFVLDQAVALRRRRPGLEIHVVAPHDEGAARYELVAGIHVHRFPYFWPARLARLAYPAILPNLRRRPWLWLQVPCLVGAELVAVLRLARRLRPEVLYSHWFTPQALVGWVVGGLLGIRHVFTTHSTDAEVLGAVPVLGPALARRVTRSAAAGTAVSRRTLGKLRAHFADESAWQAVAPRLLVVPMGVDTAALRPPPAERRESLRATLGLGGRRAVLFLGRLTEKKGVPLLLRAFAALAATRDDVMLLIAGDGEERRAIERDIEALLLAGRVRLLGHLGGEEKRAWLHAADVLALPSVVTGHGDAEGLPVVLLEGLAAGQVCVASDASGAEEMLTDGVDGFLFPAGDAAALTAALARALALDAGERAALAARALERARPFDWDAIADAHYRHLLARP
jgi:glycosyltransferase involved in cell wall biosynthesis